ncbi:hypothetical protein NNC58_01500 [Prevotella copri]|uniref:Uncharacterized protein n=1 Tax=Segatella copri TaxID=165179 RepID=A0AAW5IHN2_9BACT|nr:hypothetical protein [Segatella copri]MCP9533393.1 hypothetical protein [Segatella copri]MCP9536243.1 hypothetical protein [Segatella copri]MCP9539148.1 hypothetical protein [Segatella copri]MCP9557535.1 hypothetical protein [Segatella copri]MCP9560389.1 hypothetical protein [Segatella copri]
MKTILLLSLVFGCNLIANAHQTVKSSDIDNLHFGDFIFEDGKLDKYLFDGGYCSFYNSQNPTFHYYEKDHLGSVRMVVNENGTIEQVNHYYPFGGVYGDLSYNSEYQKSKYIGKEFDHMHGLDWYDHGARMYDAARVASTSENYEIDADALRRMIDKLLRLNTNSHLIFK